MNVMMFPQSRGGPYKLRGVIASIFAPGENTAPKSKLFGKTPMTVVCCPLMSYALPTMAGSALNWRRHHASVRTTTGAAPLRASSGLKARPMAGCTPSTWKKLAMTSMLVAGIGAPPRLRLKLPGPEKAKYPVTSWYERLCTRKVS
jgi:hypothetical protein